MLQKIKINTSYLKYIFGEEEKDIELNLGSIQNEFWGSNILMFSAIVGRNGTGKTTLLKEIKDSDLRGINSTGAQVSSLDYLKIYYSPNLNYEDDHNDGNSVINLSKYSQIKSELRGDHVSISEMLEIHNSEFYKNLILLNKNEDIHSALLDLGLPKISQYKISLLKLKEEDWNISINLRPYFDELKSIKKHERLTKEQSKIDELGLKSEEIRNNSEYNEASYKIRLELEVVHSVILKLKSILESTGNRYLEEGFIDEPISELKKLGSYKEAFFWIIRKTYFKITKNANPIFLPYKEIVDFTEVLISIINNQTDFKNWTEFYVDDDTAYDFITKFQSFIRSFKKSFDYDDYPILRFSTDIMLSNGEKSIYEIFSQMYKAKVAISNGDYQLRHNFKNYIILLDEADISFHPTWKKKYVKLLIEILPLIFKDKKLQIIFTTHDPLTLSDLPSTNILYLNKPVGGNTFIADMKNLKTFGANIHELLAESFFIDDGLMGEFAKQKIQDLVAYLTFNKDKPEGENNIKPQEMWDQNSALELIKLVGEPLIEERLQSLFDRKFIINEKEALELTIKELQLKLSKLNETDSN